MTLQEIELLLRRYRMGLCSDEEKKAIESWYEKTYREQRFEWAE